MVVDNASLAPWHRHEEVMHGVCSADAQLYSGPREELTPADPSTRSNPRAGSLTTLQTKSPDATSKGRPVSRAPKQFKRSEAFLEIAASRPGAIVS